MLSSIFALSYLLAFGTITDTSRIIMSPSYAVTVNTPANSYFTLAKAELSITPYFFIGGSLKTYMVTDFSGGSVFSPYRSDYTAEGGLRIKLDNNPRPTVLELRIQHKCDHPEISGMTLPMSFEGMSTSVYLSISGTLRP